MRSGDPGSVFERIKTGFGSFSESVPRIVSEPREYPREAMLLAVIAGLAIVLVVLILILVSEAFATRLRRYRMGVRRDRRVMLARALVWSAAGIGVLAALAASPGFRVVDRTCTSWCHVTRAPASSWADGSHADVGCYRCHARPGAFGVTSAVVREVFVVWPGEESSATARVFSDACLRCHEEIAHGVVGAAVRVRHVDLIESGASCALCHSDIGHGKPQSREDSGRSMMSRCLVCHDGQRAPVTCDTCHVRGPMDSADVEAAPTAIARVTCDGCHSIETSERCVRCHGLELPHPGDFLSLHAGLSTQDPGLCAKCHENADDTAACACHASDANVHGTYEQWFPLHGPESVRVGPNGCLCHDDGGYVFCATCHTGQTK